jgi:hypothetical protein
MLNLIIFGSVSAMIGALLLALFLIKDEPTQASHLFVTKEDAFVDEWREMEMRTGVTLNANIAHQLSCIEKAEGRLFFTVALEDADKQEQQNRFGFTKWLVANGKFTDFPVDEIA